MRLSKYLGIAVCAGALFAAQKAEASFQIGSFNQATLQPAPTVSYSGGSPATLSDGGQIVAFTFNTTDFPFLPAGDINAHFALTALTSTSLGTIGAGGSFSQEGLSGSMEFRRDSDNALLLRVVFTNADIIGHIGSPTGTFEDFFQLAARNVVYSSDFFVAIPPPTVGNQFSIALTNVTAPGTPPGNPPTGFSFTPVGSDNFLNAFVAQESGHFDIGITRTDQLQPTPAPAGLVLLLTAVPVLGLGGYFYRRRLSTVPAPAAA